MYYSRILTHSGWEVVLRGMLLLLCRFFWLYRGWNLRRVLPSEAPNWYLFFIKPIINRIHGNKRVIFTVTKRDLRPQKMCWFWRYTQAEISRKKYVQSESDRHCVPALEGLRTLHYGSVSEEWCLDGLNHIIWRSQICTSHCRRLIWNSCVKFWRENHLRRNVRTKLGAYLWR